MATLMTDLGGKTGQLRQAIRDKDLDALRKHAGSKEGFLGDDLRRKIWPLLLHIDVEQLEDKNGRLPALQSIASIDKNSPHSGVIAADVTRTLSIIPSNMDYSANSDIGQARRDLVPNVSKLEKVLLAVDTNYPELPYYQGFNSITAVLLLVLGQTLSFLAAKKVAFYWLRDFFLIPITKTVNMIELMFGVMEQSDPKLARHLSSFGNLGDFIMGWFNTWFSHYIRDIEVVKRLFDFFLSRNPLMPFYVASSMLIDNRDLLLNTHGDEIYQELKTLSEEAFNARTIEGILKRADEAYRRLPPEYVLKKHLVYISPNSAGLTFKEDYLDYAFGGLPLDEDSLNDGYADLTRPRRRILLQQDEPVNIAAYPVSDNNTGNNYQKKAAMVTGTALVAAAAVLAAKYFSAQNSSFSLPQMPSLEYFKNLITH